jgi:hypothetical protein
MNLRDLRYLVALAEHKHFGHAAEASFVSQPTLSTQIRLGRARRRPRRSHAAQGPIPNPPPRLQTAVASALESPANVLTR